MKKLILLSLLLSACSTKETLTTKIKNCSLELVLLDLQIKEINLMSPYICDIGPPRAKRLIGKMDECLVLVEKYNEKWDAEEIISMGVFLKTQIEERSFFYGKLVEACEEAKTTKPSPPRTGDF
jgi:hypothetical protein